MGKNGDGSLTPAEASAILRSEQADKGYLDYMRHSSEEVSAGVMAISLHSYHGPRTTVCDPKYNKPPGFEVRHLNLEQADVDEIVRAYKADTSPFHKVDLKHVYAVATGDDEDMLSLTRG